MGWGGGDGWGRKRSVGDLVRGLKGERKMMDGWIGRRGEWRTKSINQIKSRIQELLAVKSPARTNKKRIFFGFKIGRAHV